MYYVQIATGKIIVGNKSRNYKILAKHWLNTYNGSVTSFIVLASEVVSGKPD